MQQPTGMVGVKRAAAAAWAAFAVAACGGGDGGGGITPPPIVPGPTATQYVNPVIDADFPDPAVVRAPDGAYYAYATQTTGLRVQVSRSTDLVTWSAPAEALPTKPAWTSGGSNYFAPDVVYRDGQYLMYYAAQADTTAGTYCIGVALSAAAAGPFQDAGRPLVCGAGRNNGDFTTIDAQAFDDPQSGKRYLYWGSGFAPLVVQELAADRRSFAAGSAPVAVAAPRSGNDPSAYDVALIEAPWVTYRAPYYYLYFSGNSCCGAGAHYAVMVARGPSPTGPFEVLRSGPAARPILAGQGRWQNPGHNSVIQDAAGAEWMLYHAISSTNPFLIPGRTDISRRPMLIDRITYDAAGWPVVGTAGVPTSTPQPRPTTAP
jgi:arabinan endo-1,5-alpha-L-arabinosidase